MFSTHGRQRLKRVENRDYRKTLRLTHGTKWKKIQKHCNYTFRIIKEKKRDEKQLDHEFHHVQVKCNVEG